MKEYNKDKTIEVSSVPDNIKAYQSLKSKLVSKEIDSINVGNEILDTCFPKKDKRYLELLNKYMYDKDLQELIMLCIIDEKRECERQYVYNGKYPEIRDTIMKLYHDLTARLIAVEYANKDKGANNE